MPSSYSDADHVRGYTFRLKTDSFLWRLHWNFEYYKGILEYEPTKRWVLGVLKVGFLGFVRAFV